MPTSFAPVKALLSSSANLARDRSLTTLFRLHRLVTGLRSTGSEAVASSFAVGGAQIESDAEAAAAVRSGKAAASVIGTRAMGTRFNAVMTIQVPLLQNPIRLTINTPSGVPLELMVSGGCTVNELKDTIQEEQAYQWICSACHFCQVQVEASATITSVDEHEHSTIDTLGIINASVLTLRKRIGVQVHVSESHKRPIRLDVELHKSVGELKTQLATAIAARDGKGVEIPLRLKFDGVQMDDARLVGSYGINQGSQLERVPPPITVHVCMPGGETVDMTVETSLDLAALRTRIAQSREGVPVTRQRLSFAPADGRTTSPTSLEPRSEEVLRAGHEERTLDSFGIYSGGETILCHCRHWHPSSYSPRPPWQYGPT